MHAPSTLSALRRKLIERDITQRELARRMGVSAAYVCQVIHGTRRASAKVIARMERALDIPAGYRLLPPGSECVCVRSYRIEPGHFACCSPPPIDWSATNEPEPAPHGVQVNGKELLLDGTHLADANSEETAQAIALMLNRAVLIMPTAEELAIAGRLGL